ncbi:YiiX/YebB-like N1pC/P60 family cysteine hydrolase [Bradyrhizobium mercantei]|uniref:YiiX/YebB-like N1pC/P60 family cysteine hydrolase n=1 Tax=Bradyrhizobium mercantei TaxID=1904807 RepID=UPI000976A534
MQKLNDQRLQVGDIILTSGPNKVSKAVRRATGSDISHAMVYVQHSSIIDATAEGVHSSNIQRMFFEDDSAVYVLRSRLPLGEEATRKITDFARAATGTEYSKSEAVAVVARKMRRARSRKQFCSRLAAQAYAFGGVSLVPDPDYCTVAHRVDAEPPTRSWGPPAPSWRDLFEALPGYFPAGETTRHTAQRPRFRRLKLTRRLVDYFGLLSLPTTIGAS